MNLELISAWTQCQVPDRVECELIPPECIAHPISSLPSSSSATMLLHRGKSAGLSNANTEVVPPTPTSLAFNRRGHYLAAAYADGRVLIWDFYTRHGGDALAGKNAVPALAIDAHARQATSVSWSRRSRQLLSSGMDHAARLWDLTSKGCGSGAPPKCVAEAVFIAPISFAQLNPHCDEGNEQIIALLASGELWIVDMRYDNGSYSIASSHGIIGSPSPTVPIAESKAAAAPNSATSNTKGSATCKETRSLDCSCRCLLSPVRSGSFSNYSGANASSERDKLNHEQFLVVVTAASYDGDGRNIIVGTSKGEMFIIESDTVVNGGSDRTWTSSASSKDYPNRNIVDLSSLSTTVPLNANGVALATCKRSCKRITIFSGTPQIKLIRYSASGRWMLLIAGDKIIRMYSANAVMKAPPFVPGVSSASTSKSNMKLTTGGSQVLVPACEFTDKVDGRQWRSCCFSHDEELVVGATEEKGAYRLYFWNREGGHLVKSIFGPKRQLLELAWHPVRSFAAVATKDGPLQLWTTDVNWAAFAPEFQEIEENEEYMEREDEFDKIVVLPQSKKPKALCMTTSSISERLSGNCTPPPPATNVLCSSPSRRLAGGSGNFSVQDSGNGCFEEDVDIVGIAPLTAFESDSEDEEFVFYLKTEVGSHANLNSSVVSPSGASSGKRRGVSGRTAKAKSATRKKATKDVDESQKEVAESSSKSRKLDHDITKASSLAAKEESSKEGEVPVPISVSLEPQLQSQQPHERTISEPKLSLPN